MVRRKNWNPERMNVAIEAMRNEEMGSYKASRFFSLSHTTLQRCVKDRQKNSSEAMKKVCRKHVFPCEVENDLTEHCLVVQRKFLSLTVADVVLLAYQLAVRNGIKNQFCKRN